ncbi:leucine-rich repeat and IQ domain-containing protein 3 isoform X1 [Rhinatrema bivittatum]|uniref:leucine-rich repeat and IQ domain-containing protein 3 isoform X1 n=1 Tax=Rhinatrema bivittatum TaxID=194408 RepID=UPI00112BB96C|nr:leucine-rich repeat and IQ domain-containing protein 3 isoform X1 [Rhinatrema bivittatum]XP_029474541.1 leucine-rich repeat and IQ domain-containing protein 3 isoform X1 [Rhinatrema bivittatum]
MKELTQNIYLTPSSEKLLIDHGQNANQSFTEKLQDLVLVRLNNIFLKDVVYLQYCLSLKVCILPNNYLTNINPLRSCSRLVKLDLHGNQIQHLPEKEFWSEMSDLKLLFLHNNSIGKLTNVQSLSVCPNLTGLTLFDTPLSLNQNYRHIVVNSIWSLKALDNYVISDEEIIEDWPMNERFKALNPRLFLNFLPVLRKKASFQDEINVVKGIISKINQILAHNSPVLIVQSTIRGYLTRKRIRKIPSHRMKKQEISLKNDRQEVYCPSLTLLDKRKFINYIIETKQTEDYGKDMKPSFIQEVEDDEIGEKEIVGLSFDDEEKFFYTLLNPKQEKERKQQKTPSHLLSKELICSVKPDVRAEKIEFRLPVFKAIIYQVDPVRCMLLSNQDIGRGIRLAVRQCHSMIQNTPKPKVVYQPAVSLKRKIFAKMQDSFKLVPFYTVDKAYEERERYKIQAEKAHRVQKMYCEKIIAKQNIEEVLKNKSKNVLKKRETDDLKLQEALQQCQLSKSKEIEKAKQKYISFVTDKKQRRAENLLVQKFNSQHNSLTNALLRHDKLLKHENIKRKHRIMHSLEGKKIYPLIPREQMLQTEHPAEKVAVTSTVFQKANDKLLQARAHVTSVKVQKASVEPLYRIPEIQTVTRETWSNDSTF